MSMRLLGSGDPAKLEKIRNGWNKFADEYTTNFEPLTLAVAKRLFINGHNLLPNRPLDIVEFGCGSGLFADYYLRSRIPIQSALLYDISDEMLHRARSRLDGHKTQASVSIIRNTPEILEALPDSSFDIIFANLFLNVVDNPVDFLSLFRRVLRKDGLVACSTNSNATIDSIFDFWDDCMAQVHPEVYKKHKFKYQLGDDFEARRTFKSAGFEVRMASMDKVRFPWSTVTLDKIWAEPMNQASLKLLTPEQTAQLRQLLDERLKEDQQKRVIPNLVQNTYWLRLAPETQAQNSCSQAT